MDIRMPDYLMDKSWRRYGRRNLPHFMEAEDNTQSPMGQGI